MRCLLLVMVQYLFVTTLSVAQQVRIEGIVDDATTGEPVHGAVVSDNGRPVAITEPSGRFSIPATSSRTSSIEVRRIGYFPRSLELVDPEPVLEVRIVLDRLAVELEPIEIEALPVAPHLRGFEERRRIGFGYFITREMLEQGPGAKASDFLRVIPSISVSKNSMTGDVIIRSRRAQG